MKTFAPGSNARIVACAMIGAPLLASVVISFILTLLPFSDPRSSGTSMWQPVAMFAATILWGAPLALMIGVIPGFICGVIAAALPPQRPSVEYLIAAALPAMVIGLLAFLASVAANMADLALVVGAVPLAALVGAIFRFMLRKTFRIRCERALKSADA